MKITLVKSSNGSNPRQRDTLRSLGLRRIGQTVERPDSPQVRGMVHAVQHLVKVEEEVAAKRDRPRTAGGRPAVSERGAGGPAEDS